jgi:hypothetical protein
MWGLVDAVSMGQVLFEHFSFIIPVAILQMLHAHLSSGGGAIGPFEVSVPNDFSLTPFIT